MDNHLAGNRLAGQQMICPECALCFQLARMGEHLVDDELAAQLMISRNALLP
jgi:hypothetical protein